MGNMRRIDALATEKYPGQERRAIRHKDDKRIEDMKRKGFIETDIRNCEIVIMVKPLEKEEVCQEQARKTKSKSPKSAK